jgi:hypothetical protein
MDRRPSMIFAVRGQAMGVRHALGWWLAGGALITTAAAPEGPATVVRVSALGFAPGEAGSAVVASREPLRGRFRLLAPDGSAVARGPLRTIGAAWGAYAHHAVVDLREARAPGTYRLVVEGGSSAEAGFRVSRTPRDALVPVLLAFLRQQRCGYNPFLDEVCHPFDGRVAYGPRPAGSYLDARGGWHDAADQLKYLLTSSTVVGQLLLAHRLRPGLFADDVDALGRAGANGRPDVLDEARWGLEWMARLHPSPGELYHQVADDRDHIGWKLPHRDTSDYGWGPGSYRVVYFADGRPQGLGAYPSQSTGIANLAGRYAAAMALAHQAWRGERDESGFAARCLRAAMEVYALGRRQEGVQQGNSYGAPYRYAEETWADDMEWGAAELFRSTGDPAYLADARRYARMAGATSWIGRADAGHYQYYPFVNVGHFALHAAAAGGDGAALAGYYREGLEEAARRSAANPYGVGVPFLWCSNNLVTALATQSALYERMTGDRSHRGLLAAHRDWLLGRNPWGLAMVSNLDGVPSPRQPHLSTARLTGRPVPGGLVDGPVHERIFASLKGATLSEPDSYAAFQGPAVFHDDALDYSTNEPTLDGTASLVLLLAALPSGDGLSPDAAPPPGPAASPAAPGGDTRTRPRGAAGPRWPRRR